tara:strand:- start:392 stop:547 length:156 start_codon:yes stop_codon:yes gene_type:complete
MRSYLNLEKHHIEILLQLVQEEIITRADRRRSVRYLEALLQETLDNIDKGM